MLNSLVIRCVSNAAIDRAGINYAAIQVVDNIQAHSAPVESLVRQPVDCVIQLGVRSCEPIIRRSPLF